MPDARPAHAEGGAAPDAAITVVIPTFNRSAYLIETLESVLGQGRGDFRVLVADNASSDDTALVMQRYGDDPRVQYLRRPENIGWLRNFNESLASVRTPYVTILNDDDLMAPGALARTVALLDAHPRVGMVHAAHDSISPEGIVLERGSSWTHGLRRDTVEPGRTFIRKCMKYYERVCPPSAAFRTAALPATPYEPRDEPHAVFVLYLRIALEWNIGYLAESGVVWRVHSDQDSASMVYVAADGAMARCTETIDAMREVRLRFIDEHADRLVHVRSLRRRVAHFVDAEHVGQARAEFVHGRGAVLRRLATSARASPAVLVRGETWRLLVRTIVGARGVRWYRKVFPERSSAAGRSAGV